MPKVPKTNKKCYEFLYETETNMRLFIVKQLNKKSKKISAGGWLNLVSMSKTTESIPKKCESRRRNEAKLPYQILASSAQLLDYSDFHDLKKIILNNWDIFQHFFNDQSVVNTKFDEIEPIRNAIAHSRKLPQAEFTRLKIICRDLNRCISKR
jgi:hypothetical protein